MPVFVNKVYFRIVYGYFWLLYGPLIKFANPCTKISPIVKIQKTSNETLPEALIHHHSSTSIQMYFKKILYLLLLHPHLLNLLL